MDPSWWEPEIPVATAEDPFVVLGAMEEAKRHGGCGKDVGLWRMPQIHQVMDSLWMLMISLYGLIGPIVMIHRIFG